MCIRDRDQLHREDGPAIEWSDGSKEWYLKGQRHRENGPAVEWSDGTKEWWVKGQRHREEGPAIEYSNGAKYWYLKGQCHREDGPAVEWSDGSKYWWFNGQRHREDGPAIEYSDGSKAWYLNGQRHREDGPAIEHSDGDKYWYLKGQQLTEPEWKQKVKKPTKPTNISTTQGDLDINYSLKENIKKILKELNIRPSPGSIKPQHKNQKAIEVVKDQLREFMHIGWSDGNKKQKESIDFFAENIVGLVLGGDELDLEESKNILPALSLDKEETSMAIAVLNQAIKEWQKWKTSNPDDYGHADKWIEFFENEKKKYSIKESKFDGDIKSSLDKIIQQVWSEKDLNKAKNIVTSYLNDSKIKDEDKKKMTQSIDKITTKGKLDYYLANSLLKYEGSGLSQLKKAGLKESQKPKCQCQQ